MARYAHPFYGRYRHFMTACPTCDGKVLAHCRSIDCGWVVCAKDNLIIRLRDEKVIPLNPPKKAPR